MRCAPAPTRSSWPPARCAPSATGRSSATLTSATGASARACPPSRIAVIVSRTLDLDPSLPLLADRSSHVVILTPAAGDVPYCRARVDYIRSATLRAGLAELRRRSRRAPAAVRGRPHTQRVVGRGVADRRAVHLDLAAAGRRRPGAGSLLHGGAPPSPQALELRMLLEHKSQLYAHYAAAAPLRIARRVAAAPSVADLAVEDLEQLGGQRAAVGGDARRGADASRPSRRRPAPRGSRWDGGGSRRSATARSASGAPPARCPTAGAPSI